MLLNHNVMGAGEVGKNDNNFTMDDPSSFLSAHLAHLPQSTMKTIHYLLTSKAIVSLKSGNVQLFKYVYYTLQL